MAFQQFNEETNGDKSSAAGRRSSSSAKTIQKRNGIHPPESAGRGE